MEEFRKLGLSENAVEALKRKGFVIPTAVQKQVIPLLLEGKKDVVAQSQTGTGKTAAFALPIIEKIDMNSRHVQAIVLTPTRELAMQVAKEIDSLKGEKNIKILAVYGGSPIGPQRQKLRKGVDIVVGTPGRVMDLQDRKSLNLDNITYAVLDEADEMLNMGFVDDIETILKHSPKNKNMLLFSATIPKPILRIAQQYMKKYEFIEIEKSQLIINTVEQTYYDINAKDRIEALRRVIDYYVDFYGIIFCNTKATVDGLAQKLAKLGYSSAALHGDITQSQREKILQQFRDKTVTILVATDVAARGIDVNDLTHVVNFSLPNSPESYVHRIGRTGRAGKKGISVTFVIPSERRKLNFIERVNNCRLIKRKLPSAKEIVEHKQNKIKTIIMNIIEKGKLSRYDAMAEELLDGNEPEEVIAAILKYSFKNELEVSSYANISEYTPSKGSEKSNFKSKRPGRGRDRGQGRRRSPRRGNDRRYEKKAGSRERSEGERSKAYGGRSDKKKFGKSKSKFKKANSNSPSSKFGKKKKKR